MEEGAQSDAAPALVGTPAAAWIRLGAVAMALAAILAAAGLLFARGLNVPPSWDEGVYLGQSDALMYGQRLGTDVFTAQPPGFHLLLVGAASIGGLGVDQLRLTTLALALLGLLAVAAVARAVAGPKAGLAAAAVLAVAPSYPTFAAQISADLPGCVLATLALACMLTPSKHRRLRLVAGGLLFAAAESVKLDAFVLLLPVPLYCWTGRLRLADIGVAAAAAGAAFLAGAAVIGSALPEVWRDTVAYHVAARNVSGAGSDNVHELTAFFHLRQPFTWITAAAVATALLLRPRTRLPLWPLWVTAAAAAGFLLWHRPLHDNHMVLLAVALAPPVGAELAAGLSQIHRLRPFAVAALVLLVVAGYVQDTREMDRNAAPLPVGIVWAVKQVDAAVPPGRLVVSDEPIVPFLANRRMPGQTIDTALLRFGAGYLTDEDVLRAVDRYHVPVVIAGRAFNSRPRLLAALARRFPIRKSRDGVTLYRRSS